MRRFLVVGCGGSGGATLAYMMDQLRSELSAHGIPNLPRGWQFVHVDVPSGADPVPDGLARVQDQGGRYIPTGPAGSSYGALDATVSMHSGVLDAVATWAPRDPSEVLIPIDQGAGQYRAIGRMITIGRVGEILEGLQRAAEDLRRDEAAQELAAMGRIVPGVGEFNPNDEPIVIVVSSMAGGAGASMALDVCRILTMVNGVVPGRIGVFMYSADVFDALPKASRMGIRGNSLAMFGEIIAAQVGAASAHDQTLLSALGLHTGTSRTAPFARVFPISHRVGMNHVPFGDGNPKTVYRGLARGLAAMMMSDQASFQFVGYDLTNMQPIPALRSNFGWSADPAHIAWGSFGYASLSTGRDRFTEYAAQRIASGCVDRLVQGHLDKHNPASGPEQVRALLDQQWLEACDRMQLPRDESQFVGWARDQVFAGSERDAHTVVSSEVEPYVSAPVGGQTGSVYLGQLRQQLTERRVKVREAAEKAAYGRAYAWIEGLANSVLDEVTTSVARFGLPYAIALIDRVEAHLRNLVMPQAGSMTNFAPNDITEISQHDAGVIEGIRGAIVNGQQIFTTVLQSVLTPVRSHLLSHGCRLIEQVTPDFVMSYLTPLRESLVNSLLLLESARNPANRALADVGLARLRTEDYSVWPSDGDERVPDRFTHALNEVLLIRADDFDSQYRHHLAESVDRTGPATFAAARQTSAETSYGEVWRRVIIGSWPTTGGDRPPGNLIVVKQPWQSSVFRYNPATGDRFTAQPAAFAIHARPAEILARARRYVERPDYSFQRFARESLRDLLTNPAISEVERMARQDTVLTAFREALSRARPMISVHRGAVARIHAPETVSYRYKFSDIPFGALSIENDMRAILERDQDVDKISLDTFAEALKGDPKVSRIDIFGSYANLSPIAFDAVLAPAGDEWAATPPPGRDGYWRWRRSRPLPASLPMTDSERRAMVAGWFVGQIVGEVRFPAPPYSHDPGPAEIWDNDSGQWLAFPDPMLTPPDRFVAEYDWLPAVLESVLVAIAAAMREPLFSSLRPFSLLRALYDDRPESATAATAFSQLAAERKLVEWLRTGRGAAGSSRVVLTNEADGSIDDRAGAAAGWLERITEFATEHYLPAREGGTGRGSFSAITQRRQASATPIFRDLAGDVVAMTVDLRNIVQQARVRAHDSQLQAGTQPGGRSDSTEFQPPSAGMSF